VGEVIPAKVVQDGLIEVPLAVEGVAGQAQSGAGEARGEAECDLLAGQSEEGPSVAALLLKDAPVGPAKVDEERQGVDHREDSDVDCDPEPEPGEGVPPPLQKQQHE